MNHPQLTIDLLNTAHEMFRAAPAAAGRQIYHIGSLLAREHLALGETSTAQRLLQSVAGEYNAYLQRVVERGLHVLHRISPSLCDLLGSGGLVPPIVQP